MKRLVAAAFCVAALLAMPLGAQTTRPPAPPAKDDAPIIERPPLPEAALPPEQRLKEVPKLVPEPTSAASGLEERFQSLLGYAGSAFGLVLVCTLVGGLLVLVLARVVLGRPTVRAVGTGLVLRPGDGRGTANEHVAEALAFSAAEAAPPRAPYRAMTPLTVAEDDFYRQLVAALPELSVHPKVALSALVATSPAEDWTRLAQLPVDFVIQRRDGVVVAVIVLTGDDALAVANIAAESGYRVVRFVATPTPSVDALRTRVLSGSERPAPAAAADTPDLPEPVPSAEPSPAADSAQ